MAYFCKMGCVDKKGRKQVIAAVQCHARHRDVRKLTKPSLRKTARSVTHSPSIGTICITGVNWKVVIFG